MKPAAHKCFDCCLSHFRTSVSKPLRRQRNAFATKAEQLYTTNTFHRKREIFLYKHHLHWVLLPTKMRTTDRCSSVVYSSSTVVNFTTETSFWTAHVRLLPRLSWSRTVLLPSDAHWKPITSSTAVLLPFVTYLLTLPRINMNKHWRNYSSLRWTESKKRTYLDFLLSKMNGRW
jgi:hypothetical protein